MKKILILLIASSAALADAAERELTLDVQGMSCASCPYIVKKSITAIDGVTGVEVSIEAARATVRYDDQRTDPQAVAAAPTARGFVSTPVGAPR